jgi:hypothetical protein
MRNIIIISVGILFMFIGILFLRKRNYCSKSWLLVVDFGTFLIGWGIGNILRGHK